MVPTSHRDLLDAPLTAAFTTVGGDGFPQTSAVWYLWEDDRILVSTKHWAAKFRNAAVRPQVGLLIVDPGDEFRTLELRGIATTGGDPGWRVRDLVRAKHAMAPDAPDAAAADRTVIAFAPTRVVVHPPPR